MKLAIEILEGVPAIHKSQNKFVLIDTGSPFSFDESGIITIYNEPYTVPTSLGGMINANYLRKNIHHNVTGLIGMDILKQHSLYFNYQEKWLIIDNEIEMLSNNNSINSIPLQFINTIPVVEIFLPQKGITIKSIIDSGSKYSYTTSGFISDLSPSGHIEDFNPLLGNFSTTAYAQFEYTLGDTHHTHSICEYANLTATLNRLNVQALLGFDLLNKHPWALDFQHAEFIYFSTNQ